MLYFAYGSVQPDTPNYPVLEDAVNDVVVDYPVSTRGDVRFVVKGHEGGYPLADFGSTCHDRVYGTVLDINERHDSWLRTISMELNAKYRIVHVPVYYSGVTLTCMAFEYRFPLDGHLKVPGGDWKAWFEAGVSSSVPA